MRNYYGSTIKNRKTRVHQLNNKTGTELLWMTHHAAAKSKSCGMDRTRDGQLLGHQSSRQTEELDAEHEVAKKNWIPWAEARKSQISKMSYEHKQRTWVGFRGRWAAYGLLTQAGSKKMSTGLKPSSTQDKSLKTKKSRVKKWSGRMCQIWAEETDASRQEYCAHLMSSAREKEKTKKGKMAEENKIPTEKTCR
jgi:hypothetical protein